MRSLVLLLMFLAAAGVSAQQWDSDDLQEQVWAGRLVLDSTTGEVVDLETGENVNLVPTPYNYDTLEDLVEMSPNDIHALVGRSPDEIAEVTQPETEEPETFKEVEVEEIGDIFEGF